MSSTKPTQPEQKFGYKLGYYQQKLHVGRIQEAIITIELFDSSKVIDNRVNEIYDFMRTDLARIKNIVDLNGQTINSAYLICTPELKHEVFKDEIISFKNPNFYRTVPDVGYISYYTTKLGVMNESYEVIKGFNGVRYYYYRNGNIKEKHYYCDGFRTHTFGYYNNCYNALHYSWTFMQESNEAFPRIREYIYNQQENPVAQFVILQNKLIKKQIYDRTNYVKSIYLSKVFH